MLQLTAVSKRYDAVQALAPTDLHVRRGTITVLIGPSGCGKSTLLRLMNGLVVPDGGTVRFDGTALTAKTAPLLRQRMGYVIQDGGLFPHLTARDNVALMARHLGRESSAVEARVAELADLVELSPQMLARYPAQLSGGQAQRVALMRALMLEPGLLLLDEPLAALDPMVRSDLQRELLGIFRTLGATAVMVTHDLAEAVYFADEIVLMRDGRLVQQGPAKELFEAPAEPFVTRFVQAQRFLRHSEAGP